MTELDHLRKLLDEAGVSYLNHRGDITIGYYTDDPHIVIEAMDHSLQVTGLTAEQAMRALGRDNVVRYVGLRQGKCWERTEYSNYYCVGCGWKVTDHDSYCPECGGALHKAALDSSNCTNSERTNDACKPTTYDDGYSADRVDPGDYYEFWEPACACGNCGELIPMRKFCPNCGCRLEVDE